MISEEERKAIGMCRLLLAGDIYLHIIDEDDGGTAYTGTVNKEYNKDLETVLNLVETQNKMIELMAEFIWEYDCCEHFKNEDENFKCEGWFINRECRENCIKEYFRNKAKESENE